MPLSASISNPRVTPRAAGVGGLLILLPRWISDAYKFFPVLTASGSRLSLRVNSVQEPTRGLSKCFRSFSSALFHTSKETHGAFEWNEKVFPNSTKVLVKVT